MASLPVLQVLTLDEAAERLGVHRSTVYRMQNRGELDIVYRGMQRCTTVETVDAVLVTPEPVVSFADPLAVERAAARRAHRNGK